MNSFGTSRVLLTAILLECAVSLGCGGQSSESGSAAGDGGNGSQGTDGASPDTGSTVTSPPDNDAGSDSSNGDSGSGTQPQPPSCPIGLGSCPAGTYAFWLGGGTGGGGGGCMALPAACQSNATCGCLADAGASGGCPCTQGDGSVAVCCN
jgi:hypothetical protein